MKKQNSIGKWTSLIIILIFISLSSLACDGSLGIDGNTYEWINAPDGAKSKIYLGSVLVNEDMESILKSLKESVPSDISIIPIAGVEISIGPKDSIEKRGEEGYLWKTNSNSCGVVNDFWMIAPGKATFSVKASKSGYMEVVGEVEHGNVLDHVVIAIMVKEK